MSTKFEAWELAHGGHLPATMRAAMRAEISRTRFEPTDVLACLFGNAALVSLLWFFAPVDVYNLFFSVHGVFLFPIVLATWMMADVPATNELAPDRRRALEALGDPQMVTRLLRAKQFVLWLIVTPVVVAVAVAIGIVTGEWATVIIASLWVAIVPLATTAFGCLIGIRWPYHPIHFRDRLKGRDQWKHLWLRWSILVLVPYGVIPALGLVALVPAAIVWKLTGSPSINGTVTTAPYWLAFVVSAPLAVLAFLGGTHLAGRLATARRVALAEYLANPSLG